MTHTISAITHWISGDSMRIEFSVSDSDGSFPIGDASLEWYLFESEQHFGTTSEAVLDHQSSGVDTTLVDADGGIFDLVVDEDVTSDIVGTHWQQVVVDPPNDSKQTWRGLVEIEQ